MHTIICNQFDVVVVPFPFTDSYKAKLRPALILSSKNYNHKTAHSIMGMITTASKTKWPNDISIEDFKSTGLPVPSVLRLKLFTLDNRLIKKKIGNLGEADVEHVIKGLNTSFAIN